MTTNDHNGHLAASRIDVEPTELQRAAYALAEAFRSPDGIDWTSVEANFKALTGAAGYEAPLRTDVEFSFAVLPESAALLQPGKRPLYHQSLREYHEGVKFAALHHFRRGS